MNKVLALLLILIFYSCSSLSERTRALLTNEKILVVHGASYCLSSKVHFEAPIPSDEEIANFMNDPKLNARFSKKSLRLALAYNIKEELKAFVRLENSAEKIKTPNPEFIKVESAIYRRIQLMNLDINATTSEFGCYVDRFTEILTQMKDAESNIVSSNTLYAILAGAFLSIIDGAYVSGGVQDQFWIFAGAVAATYYSVKAIFAEVSIDFRPKSSNLKEIYYNPEKSKNFSSALWFIMTRPLIQNEKPIREMLIERWIENGFLGKDEKADRDYHINLFFGTGGISNITHISNRREMNNEVKTMIQLLSQDINAFMIEIISGYQPSKN